MGDLLYKLECQVRESRMNFYMKWREPKLYRYAVRAEYDKIAERCQKYPHRAKKEAIFRHEYAPNQTALHRVLEPLFLQALPGKSPLEARHKAAEALLKAGPDSALLPCVFGTTPLMMVCIDPDSYLPDLEMLLASCPSTASCTELKGRTALHYACMNNRSNARMIRKLLEVCPESVSVVDKDGRSPLHYACHADPCFVGYAVVETRMCAQIRKAPIATKEVWELLLAATSCSSRDALRREDKEGMTPAQHLRKAIERCDSDKDRKEQLQALEKMLLEACDDKGE